jgi:hypothetical protein
MSNTSHTISSFNLQSLSALSESFAYPAAVTGLKFLKTIPLSHPTPDRVHYPPSRFHIRKHSFAADWSSSEYRCIGIRSSFNLLSIHLPPKSIDLKRSSIASQMNRIITPSISSHSSIHLALPSLMKFLPPDSLHSSVPQQQIDLKLAQLAQKYCKLASQAIPQHQKNEEVVVSHENHAHVNRNTGQEIALSRIPSHLSDPSLCSLVRKKYVLRKGGYN